MSRALERVRREAERRGVRITELLLNPPRDERKTLMELMRARDRYLNGLVPARRSPIGANPNKEQK